MLVLQAVWDCLPWCWWLIYPLPLSFRLIFFIVLIGMFFKIIGSEFVWKLHYNGLLRLNTWLNGWLRMEVERNLCMTTEFLSSGCWKPLRKFKLSKWLETIFWKQISCNFYKGLAGSILKLNFKPGSNC